MQMQNALNILSWMFFQQQSHSQKALTAVANLNSANKSWLKVLASGTSKSVKFLRFYWF